MITPTLRVELSDGRSWLRLLLLMDPPALAEQPASSSSSSRRLFGRFGGKKSVASGCERSPGKVCERIGVLLCEEKQVLRAFLLGGDASRGLDWPTTPPGRLADEQELERYREQLGLACLIAVQRHRLAALIVDLQRAARLGDDPFAQGLAAVRVLQRWLGDDLMITPRPLPRVPLPPFELLQRTFDRILPDGRCAALYLLDHEGPGTHHGAIYCSAIVRKRHGDIDLLTDHGALSAMGKPVLVRSVRDAPAVRQLLTQRLAPPHICALLPLSIWTRLMAGDRGCLARALAARQAAIDPCPTWLMALVGAGVVRDAASRSARVATKILSKAPGGGLIAQRAEKVVDRVRSPLDALGLDPFEAMRWASAWIHRLRPLFLTYAQESSLREVNGDR